ncbi:hypothetical protein PIB30_108913, partial [Stylosanthes scabra]|nr:hypothetical protein [Stylosanthes scabra]
FQPNCLLPINERSPTKHPPVDLRLPVLASASKIDDASSPICRFLTADCRSRCRCSSSSTVIAYLFFSGANTASSSPPPPLLLLRFRLCVC